MRMKRHKTCKSALSLLLIDLGIIRDCFYQLVVCFVCRVILKYIENEIFLDGLSHAVKMERNRFAIRTFSAEYL